mgnify:CR=1 FL=1
MSNKVTIEIDFGQENNYWSNKDALIKDENNNKIDYKGKDPNHITFVRDVKVSENFGKTIGWKLLKGRDFSEQFGSDSTSVILNKAAFEIIEE